MLKIKDNIDLQELEKYGFKKDIFDSFYIYEHNPIVGIKVAIETRIVEVCNSLNIILEQSLIDVLNSLLQDNLVEMIDD